MQQNNAPKTPVESAAVTDDPFGLSLENLRAEAAAQVQNPHVRRSILRVKQGKTEEGFTNRFDKAYHSHSKT